MEHAVSGPGAPREPIGELLARLRAQSGFSNDALSGDRLRSWIQSRAIERGIDAARVVADALGGHEELALIEAHFAPPETWLFRYPESFELVRAIGAARRGSVVRVLALGAGGWAEPVSLACALIDGGAIPAIEAVDRNAAAMRRPPQFAGVLARGGLPAWAGPYFTRGADGFVPVAAVVEPIRVRIDDIAAAAGEHAGRGARFDIVAFRNASIYLHAEARARIYRAIAAVCADDGFVLVGHSEVAGAGEALGMRAHPAQGAFALHRAPKSDPRLGARVSAPTPGPQPAPRAAARGTPPPSPPASPELDRIGRLRAEIAAKPTDAAPQVGLARALLDADDRDGAAEAVQRALYLDRFHEDALLLAAHLAELRGASADAERLRQRALRVHLDRMRSGEQG